MTWHIIYSVQGHGNGCLAFAITHYKGRRGISVQGLRLEMMRRRIQAHFTLKDCAFIVMFIKVGHASFQVITVRIRSSYPYHYFNYREVNNHNHKIHMINLDSGSSHHSNVSRHILSPS